MTTATMGKSVYDNMTRKERKAAKKAGLLIMATDARTHVVSRYLIAPELGVVERNGRGYEVQPIAGVSGSLGASTGGSTVTADVYATVTGPDWAWVMRERSTKGDLPVWLAQLALAAISVERTPVLEPGGRLRDVN